MSDPSPFLPIVKRIFVLFCLCLGFETSFSQRINPGGVERPVFWHKIDESKTNSTSYSINYHPVQFIPRKSSLPPFDIQNSIASQATIFTVFSPGDTSVEKVIWYLEQKEGEEHLLTSHRIVDFEAKALYPIPLERASKGQIHTYFFSKKEDLSNEQKAILYLGTHPRNYELPVKDFKGFIPEMIIYDRVLSDQERIQVESYLMLKYGIGPSTYSLQTILDSSLDTLWSLDPNGEFIHNLTGIGRDNISGLYQKQSQNINNPNLLSIGLDQLTNFNHENQGSLSDQEFLIWGGNGRDLWFKNFREGFPKMLSRKWMVRPKSEREFPQTQLSFHIGQLPIQAKQGEIYWLIIDRSGTGEFPSGLVDLIPATSIDDEYIHFNNLYWDTDRSGEDIFTITKGPPLLTLAWVDPPECYPDNSGSITLQIFGPNENFQGEFINQETKEKLSFNLRIGEPVKLLNISTGEYLIKIDSETDLSFLESIFIQSQRAPIILLDEVYELPNKETITLDASLGLDPGFFYYWEGPNSLKRLGKSINIDIPGDYRLYVDDDGCKSLHEFQVNTFNPGVFNRLILFPNPISAGDPFSIQVLLKEIGPIEISIMDDLSKQLKTATFFGSDYYYYSDFIETSGTYNIIVRSKEQEKSLRLIVR